MSGGSQQAPADDAARARVCVRVRACVCPRRNTRVRRLGLRQWFCVASQIKGASAGALSRLHSGLSSKVFICCLCFNALVT